MTADHLGLHGTSVSRRVNSAITTGLLTETTATRGKRLLELGDAMPEDAGVLPSPEEVTAALDEESAA